MYELIVYTRGKSTEVGTNYYKSLPFCISSLYNWKYNYKYSGILHY